MNIQRMLVQRDNVSCGASALTSLSTEQDRRKRKVKQELPHPRTVTSAGSSVRGAGEVPPPPNDDVIARLARPNYQRDFQALALYGPHGVGCQLPAQDVLTLEDGQCLADTVVNFHNMGHYSLVIATKLRTMVSGKLSETAEGSVELVHYDSAQLHTKRPEVMEGVKKMLLMLHKAQLPTADRKQAEDHLNLSHSWVNMVPSSFPKEDEVRTDLATAVRHDHLDGEDQLLSGAAHKLQAHGTPLLALSTSKNHVDHMDPTPTVANPMRAEQDHPTAPVTPAAPPTVSRVAKYTTRTGQQIRLGAYNVELDAAYAYAATAFVIRRKDHIPHTKELTDAEKASLDGCVRDDVRHLVKARMWWRWRQWRTAMAELGIAPGTPFPLENHGTRSTSNSSGDDDVEDRMVETGSG
ncbi:unnamed protein product [Closterium sp. NIES-64]|nr:unnamed protein product [Closterium sp. NIES-64]